MSGYKFIILTKEENCYPLPLSKDAEDTFVGFFSSKYHPFFFSLLPEVVIEIWVLLILGYAVFFLWAFFLYFLLSYTTANEWKYAL